MDSINNIQRREFFKQSAKTVAVCACVSSVTALLNSCEYYSALEPASQGVDKKVSISPDNKDLKYPAGVTFKTFQQKKGYGAKIRFPDVNYGIPLILVRMTPYEDIACFSSLCTHDNCFGNDVSCPSGYYETPGLKDARLIQCGCHGSKYDPFQNGKAVVGPAEKPLKQFPTEFNKETGILTIKF